VAFGALALVLSLVLGRAVGAGLAGAVLFAGWILSGYANSIPAFGWAAKLTPWEWTAGHLPLAGQADWWSLLPVALVAAGLLALGVEVFVRRDLGMARARHLPQGPSVTLGLRGPVGRSFGERLPAGLAWATGAGLFGLAMAAGSKSFADQLDQSPDLTRTFSSLFPGLDMRTAGGFLQLVFVQLGFVIIGFAAVTLVAGWASDETSGRLETVLSAPLSRPSWALASAAGIGGVVMVMTVVLAAGVGIGSAAAGSGIARPVSGALALGLYALALTGVGAALLGLRARAAAPTLAVLVSATFVIDLFAPGLHLPRWVDGLALTTHLGQPMLGRWDWVGVAACLVLAVAGTGSGAVAVQRRDL
jgi:ABC-2 type transport system permease protein